ncbi:MAG: hypothetical protein ABW215_14175 [Kibdelosporangium sp.]
MSRTWGIAAIAAVAFVTGCGAVVEGQPVAQEQAPTSAATPRSSPVRTTSASSRPTGPVTTITAACPLLSNDDLTDLLNNGKDANLTPKEIAEQPDADGGKIYRCDYLRNNVAALALVAREFASNGLTAAESIDAVGKASNSQPTPVTGAGEAAVFYSTSDGSAVVLAAAKTSGKNLRLAVLSGPKALPKDKLTAVAAAVMQRL